MKITREELKAAAVDARLDFSAEETEPLRQKYQEALEKIQAVKEDMGPVDTPPLFYPQEVKNTYRNDRQEEPLPREKALANAPDADSSCFHVPRIIEG